MDNTQFNQIRKCVIKNTRLSWILEVDGQSVPFTGFDNARYFRKHYMDLGYEVEYIEKQES